MIVYLKESQGEEWAFSPMLRRPNRWHENGLRRCVKLDVYGLYQIVTIKVKVR